MVIKSPNQKEEKKHTISKIKDDFYRYLFFKFSTDIRIMNLDYLYKKTDKDTM